MLICGESDSFMVIMGIIYFLSVMERHLRALSLLIDERQVQINFSLPGE